MDYVLKSNQAKSAQKLTNTKVLIVRKMVAQEAILTVCCQTVLRARTVTSVHLMLQQEVRRVIRQTLQVI
jgi:hypothetical protein